MPTLLRRLGHQIKLLVGKLISSTLARRYRKGRGPARNVLSVFSEAATRIGLEPKISVARRRLTRRAPDFNVSGKIESAYLKLLSSGSEYTCRAGIFSAKRVRVTFPIGMHRIGNFVLDEMMPAPYLMTNPKYYLAFKSLARGRKQTIPEGILVSMPWQHNFYHWMIEILPRLIAFDRCPELHHVPLVVPESAPSFVSESLQLAGYGPQVRYLENGIYEFERLHFISRLAPTNEVSPDAIEWLQKKFEDVPSKQVASKKLYVSRHDARIRYVSNESELSAILSDFGFTTVVMSDLELADQVNAFRSADFIVGAHGAGFSNLAFSRPGTTFIEFFPNGHFSGCFNNICAIRDLKYGFLVGEPTALGGFSINPEQLQTVLAQARC